MGNEDTKKENINTFPRKVMNLTRDFLFEKLEEKVKRSGLP